MFKKYQATIDYATFLEGLGTTIIIQTARGMRSCGGNLGIVHAHTAADVYDVIKRFNIPCDGLYYGKPCADCYIDDLVQNACLIWPRRPASIKPTSMEESTINWRFPPSKPL